MKNTTKKDEPKSNFLNILKKSTESARIAFFYGFYPVNGPTITKKDYEDTKDMDGTFNPEEKSAILRELHNKNINPSPVTSQGMPQPLMTFIERPFHGSTERKNSSKILLDLSVINSSKSISEALLIQAARAILENAGWKNTIVKVNSVGNKDSVSDFERRMGYFLRKRIDTFSTELRQLIKKDVFFITKTKDEKYQSLKAEAPQPMDCLSEESRLHFKEILEFLEIADIPYVIDSSVVGDMKYATDTVFEIVSNEENPIVLASGMRWNRLSRKLEYKKEIPAVSLSIYAKALKPQKALVIKEQKPKFYLIQFGPEAKLKCIMVLERLRRAGIFVLHSLAKDKLATQITGAEMLKIPYILLLGQKEALENSVIVRNTDNRSQVSITIEEIAEYAKKI